MRAVVVDPGGWGTKTMNGLRCIHIADSQANQDWDVYHA